MERSQMQPDKLDGEKLYVQLTNILLARIRSGEWRTGRQIPTEEDLCKGFGVSKITVRRAINNLVMEGYLEKIQGKGTFVRQSPSRTGMPMKTSLIESVFLPGDSGDISVVERKVVHSVDDEVIRRMGPVIDRDLFYLERIQSAEGVPVLVNEVYVPLRVCPEIMGWDPESGPFFEYLRERASTKITAVSQTVEVGKAGERLAGLLNCRPTSACMVIHRLFTSAGDLAVAYSMTTARGDRFHLDSEYSLIR